MFNYNKTMTVELNIVELIETNPITKLSDTYNIKLLTKIKSCFSGQEQQLFVSSFYCYLNYDKNEFVVDLDHVWTWLGFSQKIRAREVLERHFEIDIDYKNFAFSTEKAKDTQSFARSIERAKTYDEKRGGHNYKKIMLTIKCFKYLCLNAQTKKAGEIHEYYMKLEEVLHEVMEEEAIEFKKQLEQKTEQLTQKTEQLEQKTAELKVIPEQEKHKLIMKQYGAINGSLIYVARIKTLDNGSYIIKIGESRKGVRNRYNEFKVKYGSQTIFLDAFLVNNSAGLEKFLHGHDLIRPNKVTDLKGHEKENELFLIGQNLSYQTLLKVIEDNSSRFEYSFAEFEQLRMENETLKLEIAMLKSDRPIVQDYSVLKELHTMNKLFMNKVNDLDASNKNILSQLNAMQTKTTTKFDTPDPHIGPRLQKIHPETLQLVHVYETVTEAMKDNSAIKRPSVNKAIRENTVYQGFRWQLVDRELDPQTIHQLEPTKKTRPQNLGYIAKVNKEKTEILNIYINRKTAAVQNGYASTSALDTPVKNGTLTNGYYYMLLDSCEDLKEKWTLVHGECILYKDGVGQYNSENKIIKEFTCKYDCMTQLKISQKSMAKALDKDVMYDKCFYKSLREKLYMIGYD
jgi:hypothetical protein